MLLIHSRRSKFFLLVVSLLLLFISCREQVSSDETQKAKDSLQTKMGNEYASIDQSPLDISYCPPDFPQKKMANANVSGSLVARVIYSRPHKKGRVIFGEGANSICPFGKAWRLGANESTEIEFFKPSVIEGNSIKAGRYVMYCIPHPDKWVIVLNSNLDSWGLNIDPSKDIFKFEVPTQVQSPRIEDFTMAFQETASGADLLMGWDNVKVILPITYSK